MSGFPIIVRAVLERIPKVVLQTAFARGIYRKGGSRTAGSASNAMATLPVPILSIEGGKAGCSVELQSLIGEFRDDGQAAEDALLKYIEDRLGETIAQAYPDKWEAAGNGEKVTIEINLGTDVVTLTLGQCIGESEDTPCEVELEGLIAASNWTGLRMFIEARTGQEIGEAVPEWNLVALDGVTRQGEVIVCGRTVELTISGSLTSVRTCKALSTHTLTLTQNDFELSPIKQGPLGTNLEGDFLNIDPLPYFQVHLENPRVEWLKEGLDNPILDRALGNRGTPTVVDGSTYWPVYRINGSYTADVALHHEHRVPPGATFDAFDWIFYEPPIGVKVLSRLPSGSTLGLTVDDPIRDGTISFSGVPGAAHDVQNSDYAAVKSQSAPTGTGGWWIPPYAIGGLGVSPLRQELGGTTWEEFVDSVNAYEAGRSVYEPQVSADNDIEGKVAVSFMTRENALYVTCAGCNTSISDSNKPYNAITVVWGGYYWTASESPDASTGLRTNSIKSATDRDWLEGIVERHIRNDDVAVGVAHTNYKRILPAPAGSYIPSLIGEAPDTPSVVPCISDARCITPGAP